MPQFHTLTGSQHAYKDLAHLVADVGDPQRGSPCLAGQLLCDLDEYKYNFNE